MVASQLSPEDQTGANTTISMSLWQQQKLCDYCKRLDLDSLLQPTSYELAFDSLKECEDSHTLWLKDFVYATAVQNKRCPLCSLIIACAERAYLWKKTKEVCCCIRTKFTWAPKDPRSGSDTNRPAGIVHTGAWHVWFYEDKREVKRVELPDPSALQDLLTRFKLSSVEEPVVASTSSGTTAARPRMRINWPHFLNRSLKGISKPQLKDTQVRSAIASWTFEAARNSSSLAPGREHSQPFQVPHRYPVGKRAYPGLLQTWLHRCHQEHGHLVENHIAQTRLTRAFSSDQVRAINIPSGRIMPISKTTRFTALSYVWGRRTPLHFLEGIFQSTADYPRIVQEALQVTRQLGIEWLWVDRLCIRQDEEEEKAVLVPVIKDIFALAELTIVAASGEGASTSLPGVSDKQRDEERVYELPYRTTKVELLPTPPSFNALYENCVWKTRGWTFEEQVFSRRLLYVFPNELIFSCSKGTYRESSGAAFSVGSAGSIWGDGGTTPPTISGLLHAKFNGTNGAAEAVLTAREFVQAVEEYTCRDLTFEEDRIKAFAGLVVAPSRSLNPVSEEPLLLHGHPLQYFETALTWHPQEGWPARTSASGRPVAPSWGWASAGTKVDFFDDGEEHTRSCWFKYSMVDGKDILGIPVEEDIPIVSDLGLKGFAQTVQEAAEARIAPPSYEQNQTGYVAEVGSRLPFLHLVTVIFEATLEPINEGQHCLSANGNDDDTTIVGRWSIRDVSPWRAGLPGLPQLGSCTDHFAIVGGNTRMYIMLLAPHVQPGIFVRRGLYRLPVGPFGTSASQATRSMFTIMEAGHPRWACVRIA